MKPRRILATARLAFPLAAISLTLSAPSVFAATYTWDTSTTSGFLPADGNWDTSATNWATDGTGTVLGAWAQTNTTTPLHAAVFAGSDSTLPDTWDITLASQMATQSLTFNNSGYKITGSTIYNTGVITVAADKTATINSLITGPSTTATVTLNSGSTLNLGGGFNNRVFNFKGAGTLNITGGTSAPTGATYFINAATNQSGGTMNLAATTYIAWTGSQNIDYTVSGTGTLNLNSATSGSFLGLARNIGGGANYTGALNVQTGGTVNIGTTNHGSLYLVNTLAGTNFGSALLNVTGGTLTVGTGQASNVIMFFHAGSGSNQNATMTQSNGTVTANGIQLGNTSGTYDAGSLAKIQLSGGNLYVGALGIAKGSGAATLPYLIQLQGGTLGADQNWSSSLDMKLGTTGGGPTIRAQNSGATARNITLSGILSDDGAVNGTLTKTGTGTLTLSGGNTYSGATAINEGRLQMNNLSAYSPDTAFTIASGSQLFNNFFAETIANDFTLSGTGTTDITTSGITGGVGALRVFNTLVFTGTMDLAADTRIGVRGTAVTNTFNGQITGAGGLEFLASVTANDTIQTFAMGNTSTANSYAGNTTISIGDNLSGARTGGKAILRLDQDDQISNGVGKGIVVFNGPDADHQSILELNGKNETINGLSNVAVAGAVIQNTSTGSSTLTIGDADTTSSFSGLITDGGTGKTLAITKTGSGTLTLSGTNTYTGDTTVDEGTLTLSATGSIANSASVKVASGATLDVSAQAGWTVGGGSNTQNLTGSGNVTGATIIAGTANNGTHNAGDSTVGKQTFSSSLTYNSGSIFEWDLNANTETGRGTNYDAVDVTTLNVDSGAIFKVVLGSGVTADPFWTNPAVTRTWSDIFSFTTLVGSFNTADIVVTGPGAANTGLGSFSISGSSLTWTAVPEPTTALAGLLIGAGLLRRRRNVGC